MHERAERKKETCECRGGLELLRSTTANRHDIAPLSGIHELNRQHLTPPTLNEDLPSGVSRLCASRPGPTDPILRSHATVYGSHQACPLPNLVTFPGPYPP